MNKYRVSYQEDSFTTIEEIVCLEEDIEKLANEHYENNKGRLVGVARVYRKTID